MNSLKKLIKQEKAVLSILYELKVEQQLLSQFTLWENINGVFTKP